MFYIIHLTGKYIRLHKCHRVFGKRVLRLNNLFLLDTKILTLSNSSITQIPDGNSNQTKIVYSVLLNICF